VVGGWWLVIGGWWLVVVVLIWHPVSGILHLLNLLPQYPDLLCQGLVFIGKLGDDNGEFYQDQEYGHQQHHEQSCRGISNPDETCYIVQALTPYGEEDEDHAEKYPEKGIFLLDALVLYQIQDQQKKEDAYGNGYGLNMAEIHFIHDFGFSSLMILDLMDAMNMDNITFII
jgi:hypothetical protein